MCYHGVQLDPARRPCSGMALLTLLFNPKVLALVAFAVGGFYYGWPIIEAILNILPVPGIDKATSIITGFFALIMTLIPIGGSS